MPLLTVKTSAPQPAAAEVESLLLEISGRIARHLGKPEAYVMTAFEGAVPMTFAGSTTEPVCYLELKSVGTLSPATTKALSADLCALIEERLGVAGGPHLHRVHRCRRPSLGLERRHVRVRGTSVAMSSPPGISTCWSAAGDGDSACSRSWRPSDEQACLSHGRAVAPSTGEGRAAAAAGCCRPAGPDHR